MRRRTVRRTLSGSRGHHGSSLPEVEPAGQDRERTADAWSRTGCLHLSGLGDILTAMADKTLPPRPAQPLPQGLGGEISASGGYYDRPAHSPPRPESSAVTGRTAPREPEPATASTRLAGRGETLATDGRSARLGESQTRLDPRSVEIVDEDVARILRSKTGAERLSIAFGLYTSARRMLTSMLRADHSDWSEQQVREEVVRRLSHGYTAG